MIDVAKLQALADRVRSMDPSEPDMILCGPGVCEVDWGTTRWLGPTTHGPTDEAVACCG